MSWPLSSVCWHLLPPTMIAGEDIEPQKPPLCQSYNIRPKRRTAGHVVTHICFWNQTALTMSYVGTSAVVWVSVFVSDKPRIMEEELNYVTVTFRTNGISGESCTLFLGHKYRFEVFLFPAFLNFYSTTFTWKYCTFLLHYICLIDTVTICKVIFYIQNNNNIYIYIIWPTVLHKTTQFTQ